MSVEAISWALNLAPVPADTSGKPSPACAAVLLGLANHAGPDGTASFPSVRTLVRYTRLSERTVRTCLDRLEAAGVIRPCRPEIIAAHIARADQRPQGWDLGLGLVRTDLDDQDITALERQYAGLRARIAAAQGNGVQPVHPVPQPDPDGVQQLHLVPPNGVQLTQERGAAVAPEPYIEPKTLKPSSPLRAARSANQSRTPTRLPPDFRPTQESVAWLEHRRPDVDWRTETMRFRAYWEAKTGKGGEKTDWQLTWRNWMKGARSATNGRQAAAARGQVEGESWD